METPTSTMSDAATQRQMTAERLTASSVKNKNNPFMDIVWPDSLPEDILWMPYELMTVFGTKATADLTPQELLRLSKWESIWFYSFNVHGERHLLRDVLECMHTPGYEDISEYMHHFVCEENNHSWLINAFNSSRSRPRRLSTHS